MSKYNKQNRLDEKAISIISDYFMNKHGDKFDLQFHGIKDNTPDTDGFLRLREPEENSKLKGTYLNNVVFFQLKGFEKKIEDGSYVSARKLIDFCKDINLPTILFIVSNLGDGDEKKGGAQIYWYHFSNINIEILNKSNKPNSKKIKIPNLNPLKIGKNDFVDQFYVHIKNLAKKNDFLDLPKEVLDIAIDLKNKILLVASVIYLVGKVTGAERKALAKMINVTDRQMSDIITSLHKQNLIYKDKDLYIFKLAKDEIKRDVGLLLLYESINKIDLKKLLELFTDHKQKKEIYSNLAKVRHPIVFDFLNEKADELLTYVKK
ncbi:MAG: hypothetical protein A3B98_00570 [Candidatus Taylorbacteria bacterium RIFCSPHIGHO2_02_FULL_43_55]|nr:MAG: hypothetical protein A3B98_00570 [Candidatus Taylorbacteria bacterium RIFCSPHIGHO2_02_FULL_43_55]OHA28767.1 MAG: hypothetical protein A3E92_04000 [Candidatus Taylorbacteria bacterium RIFCSPHIGHO2_12_FULL_42_34]OHA30991.1 MAG: hypothetical protein A3B09_02035 [Candidatus Taylorbacteria bacterium RIFCSPLOWO2_01_FULL_43_83]OHA39512.1 MAG: hypothetical protein A3H58_02540 [Candidatus Taylorbacteria bacterium RIFCSPLOWO2_02_FULL_43_22b]